MKIHLLFLTLLFTFSFPLNLTFAQEEDDDLLIEEVEPVEAERNRFEKEKWEKKKYNRYAKRRESSGLPAKLYLAGDDVLARDPLLAQSDISAIVSIPESKAVLTEKMAFYVNLFPEAMPDTNILFNDANVANAEAVGTGQIILPAGIISDLRTEDAVMFVLGHELAHIAFDHFKAEENRKSLEEGAKVVAMVANGMDANQASQSNELMGYMVFSEKLLGPAWSKGNEKTADEIAIDLVVRAGYNIESARSVVNQFVLRDEERERELERICGGKPGIGRAFGNLIGASFGQEKPLPPECGSRKGGLLGLGNIFSKKKSSKKRLEEFDKYFTTRYPTYESPKPTEFTGVLKRDFAADGTLQRSVYASESMEAVQNGQFQLAAEYAAAAFKQDDQSSIRPRLAMYSLLQRAGRREEALEHLDIALASTNASKAVYTFAIKERLTTATTIAAQQENTRINKIINEIFTKHGTDNLSALAAAQERHAAVKEEKNQFWERGVVPPTYDPTDIELTPEVAQAYEAALELNQVAQGKFPDASEFLITELEILRTLKRQEDLLKRIDACNNNDDKKIRAICKMALSS